MKGLALAALAAAKPGGYGWGVAPIALPLSVSGPVTSGLLLSGPQSTGAIIDGPKDTGAILTGPSSTGAVLTSGVSHGSVLTSGPLLLPSLPVAYSAPISYGAAVLTKGGGSIGVSGAGAVVSGPKTVPVVVEGPSGKIAADGLWGPTLEGLPYAY
uniref:Uncharacterized protein n=1 Tax=Dendroctonus ponderosae TaxID=77166 RepID=A0AAR5Q124_DENPD